MNNAFLTAAATAIALCGTASILADTRPVCTYVVQASDDKGTCDCPPCEPPLSGCRPLPADSRSALYFVQLSWSNYVAYNWPALNPTKYGRGLPLKPRNPAVLANSNLKPRVWETWKQDWELNQRHPSPWNSYEVTQPPCDKIIFSDGTVVDDVNTDNWPELYLRGGGTLLSQINIVASNERNPEFPFRLAGPLIDQERQYIHYEMRYNEELYNCATGKGGPGCSDPERRLVTPAANNKKVGAISVKASWRRSLNLPPAQNTFYSRDVLVLAFGDKGLGRRLCRQLPMDLVGFHISYKNEYIYTDAPGQNKWIWTTYEHLGNNPSCTAEVYSFTPEAGYSYEPKPIARGKPPQPRAKRHPVMVCNISVPQQTSTCTNTNYQNILPDPWKNYAQNDSQWLMSLAPIPTSHVTNTTLETYSQADSCMNCHKGISDRYDHLWSVALIMLDKPGGESVPPEIREFWW